MSPRLLPAADPRVETGPVRFGDDWAGLFIRGDNAAGYALYLAEAINRLEETDPIGAAVLRGLFSDLRSCDERGFADPGSPPSPVKPPARRFTDEEREALRYVLGLADADAKSDENIGYLNFARRTRARVNVLRAMLEAGS